MSLKIDTFARMHVQNYDESDRVAEAELECRRQNFREYGAKIRANEGL